ncbi:NAD(P)-binding protein [Nemania sp. NC0429]|nr:NAD(P)-binding protein [Nemania sp. NC0429]
MKLIVTGATGFVGREVIRQSLSHPKITSVIALARKPVNAPETALAGADSSKLKSVVIQDYEVYPDEVVKEFSGADACIWTVAITPTKSKTYDFEEIRRVCHTATLSGLRSMHKAGLAAPFRFLYLSGVATERDPTKTPTWMPEYCLMRVSRSSHCVNLFHVPIGETENQLLALGRELGGIEVAVAKPGFITAPWDLKRAAMGAMIRVMSGVPSIKVDDLVAAMLNQVIEGFEKEPLMPQDLMRIAGTASRTT